MATKSRSKTSAKAPKKSSRKAQPAEDQDELDTGEEGAEDADAGADFEPDDSDGDGEEIDIPEPTATSTAGEHRRDWRDVERYLERRELRKQVGDDLDDLDLDFDEDLNGVKPRRHKG
ncbi:MAG: hypothetical protein EPN72_10765 [Nevskiaceae bacterium]|nr:MAG: hypothetical protein EPN63_05775 [Nevskiaceae bacterium]TBR72227.1 MAG: hypothetical protein EPN72_10765 [Nevskiaceae bacterium]